LVQAEQAERQEITREPTEEILPFLLTAIHILAEAVAEVVLIPLLHTTAREVAELELSPEHRAGVDSIIAQASTFKVALVAVTAVETRSMNPQGAQE
jgi:hypothetical protein